VRFHCTGIVVVNQFFKNWLTTRGFMCIVLTLKSAWTFFLFEECVLFCVNTKLTCIVSKLLA